MLPETSLTTCRKNVFAFGVLFILILLSYSNTFDASWHFDDTNNILKNKPLHLKQLSLENIGKTFFASYDGRGNLYRPAACLSFALNYYFGKTEVSGYHLVNLTIHFLAAFFLYLFIQNTLNLPLLRDRYGQDAYFIALLATSLWAINPIQTQAVTYVVQRMSSMAAMFYLAAMYFYLKGRTSEQPSTRIICFILCVLNGLLAIGSKENAIMLPFSILLFDLFLVRGISKKSLRQSLMILSGIMLGCMLIVLILRGPSVFDLSDLPLQYRNRAFTLTERLLTEPRVILFYISLILYPMPGRLCLEHDFTLSTGLLNPPTTLAAILIILALVFISLAKAKRWPLISFSIIFLFLNHLIEGTVLPLELVYEHRNYLPSMFFFVPIAILLLKGFLFFSNRRLAQSFIILFIILVLISWGHSTFVRNKVWQNPGLLAFDCVEKNPGLARPHHNLGRFYAGEGLYEDAIAEYETALTKRYMNNLVGRNWTYYNLGSIYQKQGKYDQAIEYYNEALKYQPDFPPTHLNVGLIFIKAGDYVQAEKAFKRASKKNRGNIQAIGNLGYLSLLQGDFDKAVAYLDAVAQNDPQNARALRHLALAHRLQGNDRKAVILLQRSLNVNPDDPFTLLELSALYAAQGTDLKTAATMNRFFEYFRGNLRHLKAFVDEVARPMGRPNALNPHLRSLMALLAKASRNQSQGFEDLAVYCIQKKGGPAS